MKNNIKKYILMVIFLFIGLFFCDTKVYAKLEDFQYCKYELEYLNIVSEEITLVYSSGDVRFWDYNEGGSYKTILTSDGVYNMGFYNYYDSVKKYFLSGENGHFICPSDLKGFYYDGKISLTERDLSAIDPENYPKGTEVNVTLTEDKSSNKSVDDGFCTDEQEAAILQNKKTFYEQTVNVKVKEWRTKLENAARIFDANHDSSTCDAFMTVPSNAFDSAFEDYKNLYINYLNSQNCKTKTEDANVTGFKDATERSINDLMNYRKEKLAYCIQTANDLNLSEQTQEILDKVQENQNMKNSLLNQNQNNFNSMVELIDGLDLGGTVPINCEGLFGDDLLNLIKKLLNYVQISAPILLLVLGSVDFGQAVLSDDKESLKKATSKFVKRAIVCVAIFFLPYIINYLLKSIDKMPIDPLCGIK